MVQEKKKKQEGITLIALVLTIVVLLILAGISIAMLTGNNGILIQAQNAKQATEDAAEQEKVQIAVAGSRNDNGILSYEKLKGEIEKQNGTMLGDSIPTTVEVNGNFYRVSSNGEITKSILGGTLDTVTGAETTNTTVQDALGNQVVVPAGFKIVNTKDYVTDGIIIEDVSHEATKGSQFVWVPVGDVKTADGELVNIELNRYTFDSEGMEAKQYSNIISNYYEEKNISETGNITAKDDIETEQAGFRKSAKDNMGYYIARFEARDKNATEPRNSSSSIENLTVSTADQYVYNYILQPQAAKLSREMYSDDSFESDLINSFSWDTTLLFLEKFGNNPNYANQRSVNSQEEKKGTNEDSECHIFDMASNYREYSTETPKRSQYVLRGGGYLSSQYYASIRNFVKDTKYGDVSFRVILYVK